MKYSIQKRACQILVPIETLNWEKSNVKPNCQRDHTLALKTFDTFPLNMKKIGLSTSVVYFFL